MKLLVLILTVAVTSTASAASKQSTSADYDTSAVDINGIRHYRSQYPAHHVPWDNDRVQAFAPEYPSADRSLHHQGKGLFRLTLDSKTGSVGKITLIKSTGFTTLDSAAIASLRHWRWKPARWKEIYVPVTFRLASSLPPLTPGQTRLPHLPR